MCSHVRSRKSVHTFDEHCNMCAISTGGCAPMYFVVQYRIEYSSTGSLSRVQDVWKQHKSSGDVAGTARSTRNWRPRERMKTDKKKK